MKKLILLPLALASVVVVSACTGAKSAPEWKSVQDWPQLPAGREHLGNMHGDVAVSSKDEVYVSVQAVGQDNKPAPDAMAGLQVYGPDGKYLRNVPDAPTDLHGFIIRTEKDGEFLYGVRLAGQAIVKMTLDGKNVMTIPATSIPDQFKNQAEDGTPFVKLSGITVATNGDIYVSDGYASDNVHRFDSTGKYIATFGGKKAPYNFKTLHQIAIDTRFTPERLIATDRANGRIVHMSLEGELIGDVAKDLLTPADVQIYGDYLIVPELKGQISVLDKEGKVVTKFATNPTADGARTTDPSKWVPGVLLTPHGIGMNSHGDIFVSEFNIYGRADRFNRQ